MTTDRFRRDGHLLVIEGEPDGDDGWDITWRSIRCPHEPSPTMPCAEWSLPCGCPTAHIPAAASREQESALLAAAENAPCPTSATGRHASWEDGNYYTPSPDCYLQPWELLDCLPDDMQNLTPGEHRIGWFPDDSGPEIVLDTEDAP